MHRINEIYLLDRINDFIFSMDAIEVIGGAPIQQQYHKQQHNNK
jgi:hypothetical protein